VLAYAAAVGAESVRAARSAPLADAASLPAVFATMHLAWGAGFLHGCAKLGVPWRAFSDAASR
jgi:succinoglycan biosynthesis protein ExoA